MRSRLANPVHSGCGEPVLIANTRGRENEQENAKFRKAYSLHQRNSARMFHLVGTRKLVAAARRSEPGNRQRSEGVRRAGRPKGGPSGRRPKPKLGSLRTSRWKTDGTAGSGSCGVSRRSGGSGWHRWKRKLWSLTTKRWKRMAPLEAEAVESHDEAVEAESTRTSSEELTEGEATRKGSESDHSPSRRKQTSGSAESYRV